MENTIQSEPVTARAASERIIQPFPLGRWTIFKNPFGKAAKPRPALEPRQSELLLDSVKPVRNDLTDSDLEVVAASNLPAERATPETFPNSGGQSDASGIGWGRIRTQFFGVGKA